MKLLKQLFMQYSVDIMRKRRAARKEVVKRDTMMKKRKASKLIVHTKMQLKN